MAHKIPGIKAHHAIITDACRRNRGVGGNTLAWEEAVRRAKVMYDTALSGRGNQDGVEYHLVLTVLPPNHRDAESDNEDSP